MATVSTPNPNFVNTPKRDVVWWWFLLSSILVTWDIGYCLLRPRSMPGGDLHWIWSPYSQYSKIDKIYGFEAVESKNGFTNAQTIMNVLETALNAVYVVLGSSHYAAPLIGYTSASLTLAKTVLYGLQEYFCDYCSTGHNTTYDLIVFWIIPNVSRTGSDVICIHFADIFGTFRYSEPKGLWIVFPAYIVYVLGGDLFKSLRVASQVKRGKVE